MRQLTQQKLPKAVQGNMQVLQKVWSQSNWVQITPTKKFRDHQNSSSNTVRHQGNQDNQNFMGICFNCGKNRHCESECKKEVPNKSRETVEESDNKDFGLVLYDASNDSEQCKRKVKFKEMPEVIPDM